MKNYNFAKCPEMKQTVNKKRTRTILEKGSKRRRTEETRKVERKQTCMKQN